MYKEIKYAGISRVNGELKFRTAADNKRIGQLVKLGDTDVNLVVVHADTKAEAARILLAVDFMKDDAEVQALLWNTSEQKAVPAKKSTGEVRVKKTVVKAEKKAVPVMTREEKAHINRYFQNNIVQPHLRAQAVKFQDSEEA